MADHRFHWVVLLEIPDEETGRVVSGYWLGPHALDDYIADWSTEIPRFGSHEAAVATATPWLADVEGRWTVIPAVEACELDGIRLNQPGWQ